MAGHWLILILESDIDYLLDYLLLRVLRSTTSYSQRTGYYTRRHKLFSPADGSPGSLRSTEPSLSQAANGPGNGDELAVLASF